MADRIMGVKGFKIRRRTLRPLRSTERVRARRPRADPKAATGGVMKTLARRTIGVLATLVVTNAVGCFCPIGACAEKPVVEPPRAAFSQDAAAASGSTATPSD